MFSYPTLLFSHPTLGLGLGPLMDAVIEIDRRFADCSLRLTYIG